MKIKNITIGTIKLTPVNSGDPLTPKSADPVVMSPEDRKALAIAIRDNIPTLIIGETGTGKTSAVRELAYKMQQPYIRINMTGFTTPDELIGSKSVKNNSTYYEDGIITDAMKRGAILVIDEINATAPDCLFILHGLLDEDRRITMPNGEVIRPHDNFRVFATCNPDYEGTKGLNKAFMDRFGIILFMDTLGMKKETELLIQKTGIDPETADKLVKIATIARKEYADSKISVFVSTRGLIAVCNLIKAGLKPEKAYRMAVSEKGSTPEEKKLLRDYMLSIYKIAEENEDPDTPIITTRGKIDQLNEQITGLTKRIDDITEEARKYYRQYMDEENKAKEAIEELTGNREIIAGLTKDKEEMAKKLTAFSELEKLIGKVKTENTP